MIDDKLAVEEAERTAAYENVKSTVKSEVGGEIAAEAAAPTRAEAAEVESIASGLREKGVDEVVQTEYEVERGRAAARVSQVVDYIFFLIYALLALRLLLALMAARPDNAFVEFVRAVSEPFYWPFRGIVQSPSTPEGFTLALPVIVALVVYILLHMAINGLLRMLAHRKTGI
jgi:uncharacterized protein YggT (Ycf19 family)